MSGAPKVSCVIFTLNEEINLPYCLKSLKWCDDVHIVDSFSTDRTERIAVEAGVNFVRHGFTGFGDQRNWALENLNLKHEWVLILDADECTTPELVAEFSRRLPTVSPETGAFRLRRRFYLWGKWLRHSSQYPTWVVRLIRRGKTRYLNRGHAETQVVQGNVEALDNDLIDENHKDLHAWFARQNDYSSREAEYELGQSRVSFFRLLSPDPLKRREAMKAVGRRLPFRPIWFFLYSFVVRRGFMDGVAGFRFCLMKAIYQQMIVLKRYDAVARRQPEAEEASAPRKSA